MTSSTHRHDTRGDRDLKSTRMESGVRSAGGNPDNPAHPPSAAAIEGCRRCDLWRRATHGVPGEGPERGALMLVGEQPGDAEDRVGRPFVGPAGAVLNELLSEAGINRAGVYVTNAVKHFKWEPRGKRRLHRRPSVGEIRACHDWLTQEIAAVLPRVIVALGATAARSLLQRVHTIDSLRQEVSRHSSGAWIYVTYHPSALLRAQADSTRLRGIVLSDLRRAVLQFERLAQEGT
jgi:uracil-DNA glycosylase